jgi:tetratricopeptide (TPR) repeat protein
MTALMGYLSGVECLKFTPHCRIRTGAVMALSRACGTLTLSVIFLVSLAGVAQQSPSELPAILQLDKALIQIRAYLESNHTMEALRLATKLSAEKKDDVQLHLSLGVLLASEKQYKAAQLELGKADALQPGTFEILFNLGQASLRNGDNPNAELALSRALRLKPESPETQYLLAQVYTNESRPLDALDVLVRANRLAPENPDILYLMAQISISQKYYEDAIPLLEKGLQIAPGRSDLRAALGESYFKSGKFDKSIEEMTKLIEVEPSVRSYSFLGLSHTYLGRFAEAKQDFQNGLKLEPNNNFCLFHLGYIARLQGDSTGAEAILLRVLRSNPDYPDALLELANIRIEGKRFSEAAELLRKYVRVSSSPATGYYKLAMVEKNLREPVAAERDLAQFQTLSKDSSVVSHPYDHLFDYLDSRSRLAPDARVQQNLAELVEQIKLHPDQPEVLYALAEAYLKSGKVEEARNTITQLDKERSGDFRTLTGAGVLLARYGLYDDAIQHFRAALQAKPGSDDASFDLAASYFRKGLYSDALRAAMQVSEEGRKDDSYLALLGDVYAHQGDSSRAEEIYHSAIKRNPDNDQDYLSLALLEFRGNNVARAKQTLLEGQSRIPGSGRIIWGLGLASALEGDNTGAARQLERAVEMLPEWPGSYSTLGVFYYQTGEIAKAKEVLDRFKNSSARGGLDVNRIEETLAQAPAGAPNGAEPLSDAKRAQLLQLALFLADKTL